MLSYHARHPDDQQTDVARLARMAAGETDALGELYDAHSHRLFGLILRILNDRPQAEDILEEVFVEAWTHAARYDRGFGSPAGWLVGLARTRAIDRLRAGRAAPVLDPPAAETSGQHDTLADHRQGMQRALSALPAQQRDLIELAFFSGFTHSELASRFGLPIGTVKARIRAGMESLRDHVDAGVTPR